MDSFIAGLRGKEIDGIIPAKATIKDLLFDVGEAVLIRAGCFAGHAAIVDELPDVPIERLDAEHRLKLLVAMFGRKSVVELPVGDIEKL
jgi:transcription antitermination factor NusG